MPSSWNFVKMALAMCKPETMSSSGNLKRKRLVLWETGSTLSSTSDTNPWSPPTNARFGVAAAVDEPLDVASLDLVVPARVRYQYPRPPPPTATPSSRSGVADPPPPGFGASVA